MTNDKFQITGFSFHC